MHSTTPTVDLDAVPDGYEVERTYMVELIHPTAEDGGPLPYDPMRVRLRYLPGEAPADPAGLSAQAEAFRRAVRIERRDDDHAADVEFDCRIVEFVADRIVPIHTADGQRIRRGSSPRRGRR